MITRWHDFARRPGIERGLILLKSCIVMATFFYPVWWIHVHYASARIAHVPLSLAVSFLGVEIGAIVVNLLASVTVKKVEQMADERSARLRPSIRTHLAEHLSGSEANLRALRWIRMTAAHDLEICMAEALANVNGHASERLSELAIALGLTRRWRRQAARGHNELKASIERLALLHPDYARAEVGELLERAPKSLRPAVEHALTRLAAAGERPGRFGAASVAPYLARAMAAAELRGAEETIALDGIPRILNARAPQTAEALEMLAGLERAVPLFWLADLSADPDPLMRCYAARLAPFSRNGARRIAAGLLTDRDARVRAAAMKSAAALGMTGAVPLIARAAASHSGEEEARAALEALSHLGDHGRAAVRRKIFSHDRHIAALAAAALAERR